MSSGLGRSIRASSGWSIDFFASFIHQPGHRGGCFRDHAHGAMADGVALIAFAGQRRVIARRPLRLSDRMHGEQFRSARIFGFARRRDRAEEA